MIPAGPVALARRILRPVLLLQDGLAWLGFRLAMLAVAYLTLTTAGEVVMRYAFRSPSGWAPDTSAVAFAFIAFLAAPELTRSSGHAAMTFVVQSAPPPVSRWMARAALAAGFGVCALIAWFGLIETRRQIAGGVMMIAVTPIPKWLVTGAIVYALASSALYFLRHLAASFRAPGTEPA